MKNIKANSPSFQIFWGRQNYVVSWMRLYVQSTYKNTALIMNLDLLNRILQADRELQVTSLSAFEFSTLNWASGGPEIMTILCLVSIPSAGAIYAGVNLERKRMKSKKHNHLLHLNINFNPSPTFMDAPAKRLSCFICWPCFPMMAPTASAGIKRCTVSDSGCCWQRKLPYILSHLKRNNIQLYIQRKQATSG